MIIDSLVYHLLNVIFYFLCMVTAMSLISELSNQLNSRIDYVREWSMFDCKGFRDIYWPNDNITEFNKLNATCQYLILHQQIQSDGSSYQMNR